MRFIVLLFCILLMSLSVDASISDGIGNLSSDADSKVESFDNGIINWTKGFCLGIATEDDLGEVAKEKLKRVSTSFSIRDEIRSELIHKAKTNLLDIILSIRVDSFNFVSDYFEQNGSFRELFLTEIEKNIVVLPIVFDGSDRVMVSVKYSLYGNGSVEDLIYRLDDNVEELVVDKTLYEEMSYEDIVYTSLIIDLRGSYNFVNSVYEQSIFLPEDISLPNVLKGKLHYDRDRKRLVCRGILTLEEKDMLLSLFPNDNYYSSVVEGLYIRSKSNESSIKLSPSLFPTVYDSEGRKIYFKNLLGIGSRSLVQFVQYTKDSLLLYKAEIVGANPLYTTADKIKGENHNDIIIGAEDSKKLFLHTSTLDNLKKGNVFILVD